MAPVIMSILGSAYKEQKSIKTNALDGHEIRPAPAETRAESLNKDATE